MAEKKAVSLEELSHFKAKQDLFNLEKFALKSEGGSATGAVRYDTPQFLTEEQKAQARANIGVTAGGTTAPENEIVILEPETFDGTSGTMSQETLEAAMRNIGVKPVYVHCGDAFIPHTTGGKFVLYGGKEDGVDFCKVVTVNPQTLSFTCETVILSSSGGGGSDIDIIDNLTESDYKQNSVPSYGAIKRAMGNPNGLATLNESGVVPSSQLPSYVDDIIEGYYYNEKFYEHAEDTGSGVTTRGEIEGETGKIYFDLSSGNIYRWTGSAFVRINPDEITFATTSDIDELFK